MEEFMMAVTGIERNYNAYESAYAAQKNGTAKKTETKEQQAAQTGNATKQTASDYSSYLQKTYDCVKNGNVAISSAYLDNMKWPHICNNVDLPV